MAGHDAARTRLCLPSGEYDFSAPGAVSWVRKTGGGGGIRDTAVIFMCVCSRHRVKFMFEFKWALL